MAIELHHLQPGQDNELSILKARIAYLEKLNHELEEERRWHKFMGMVLDELQKADRSAREQDNHHYYKIFADGVKSLLDAL